MFRKIVPVLGLLLIAGPVLAAAATPASADAPQAMSDTLAAHSKHHRHHHHHRKHPHETSARSL
jgi:hypothetical protein